MGRIETVRDELIWTSATTVIPVLFMLFYRGIIEATSSHYETRGFRSPLAFNLEVVRHAGLFDTLNAITLIIAEHIETILVSIANHSSIGLTANQCKCDEKIFHFTLSDIQIDLHDSEAWDAPRQD